MNFLQKNLNIIQTFHCATNSNSFHRRDFLLVTTHFIPLPHGIYHHINDNKYRHKRSQQKNSFRNLLFITLYERDSNFSIKINSTCPMTMTSNVSGNLKNSSTLNYEQQRWCPIHFFPTHLWSKNFCSISVSQFSIVIWLWIGKSYRPWK